MDMSFGGVRPPGLFNEWGEGHMESDPLSYLVSPENFRELPRTPRFNSGRKDQMNRYVNEKKSLCEREEIPVEAPLVDPSPIVNAHTVTETITISKFTDQAPPLQGVEEDEVVPPVLSEKPEGSKKKKHKRKAKKNKDIKVAAQTKSKQVAHIKSKMQKHLVLLLSNLLATLLNKGIISVFSVNSPEDIRAAIESPENKGRVFSDINSLVLSLKAHPDLPINSATASLISLHVLRDVGAIILDNWDFISFASTKKKKSKIASLGQGKVPIDPFDFVLRLKELVIRSSILDRDMSLLNFLVNDLGGKHSLVKSVFELFFDKNVGVSLAQLKEFLTGSNFEYCLVDGPFIVDYFSQMISIFYRRSIAFLLSKESSDSVKTKEDISFKCCENILLKLFRRFPKMPISCISKITAHMVNSLEEDDLDFCCLHSKPKIVNSFLSYIFTHISDFRIFGYDVNQLLCEDLLLNLKRSDSLIVFCFEEFCDKINSAVKCELSDLFEYSKFKYELNEFLICIYSFFVYYVSGLFDPFKIPEEINSEFLILDNAYVMVMCVISSVIDDCAKRYLSYPLSCLLDCYLRKLLKEYDCGERPYWNSIFREQSLIRCALDEFSAEDTYDKYLLNIISDISRDMLYYIVYTFDVVRDDKSFKRVSINFSKFILEVYLLSKENGVLSEESSSHLSFVMSNYYNVGVLDPVSIKPKSIKFSMSKDAMNNISGGIAFYIANSPVTQTVYFSHFLKHDFDKAGMLFYSVRSMLFSDFACISYLYEEDLDFIIKNALKKPFLKDLIDGRTLDKAVCIDELSYFLTPLSVLNIIHSFPSKEIKFLHTRAMQVIKREENISSDIPEIMPFILSVKEVAVRCYGDFPNLHILVSKIIVNVGEILNDWVTDGGIDLDLPSRYRLSDQEQSDIACVLTHKVVMDKFEDKVTPYHEQVAHLLLTEDLFISTCCLHVARLVEHNISEGNIFSNKLLAARVLRFLSPFINAELSRLEDVCFCNLDDNSLISAYINILTKFSIGYDDSDLFGLMKEFITSSHYVTEMLTDEEYNDISSYFKIRIITSILSYEMKNTKNTEKSDCICGNFSPSLLLGSFYGKDYLFINIRDRIALVHEVHNFLKKISKTGLSMKEWIYGDDASLNAENVFIAQAVVAISHIVRKYQIFLSNLDSSYYSIIRMANRVLNKDCSELGFTDYRVYRFAISCVDNVFDGTSVTLLTKKLVTKIFQTVFETVGISTYKGITHECVVGMKYFLGSLMLSKAPWIVNGDLDCPERGKRLESLYCEIIFTFFKLVSIEEQKVIYTYLSGLLMEHLLKHPDRFSSFNELFEKSLCVYLKYVNISSLSSKREMNDSLHSSKEFETVFPVEKNVSIGVYFFLTKHFSKSFLGKNFSSSSLSSFLSTYWKENFGCYKVDTLMMSAKISIFEKTLNYIFRKQVFRVDYGTDDVDFLIEHLSLLVLLSATRIKSMTTRYFLVKDMLDAIVPDVNENLKKVVLRKVFRRSVISKSTQSFPSIEGLSKIVYLYLSTVFLKKEENLREMVYIIKHMPSIMALDVVMRVSDKLDEVCVKFIRNVTLMSVSKHVVVDVVAHYAWHKKMEFIEHQDSLLKGFIGD